MGKAEFDFRTRIGDALHHGRGIPESALAITGLIAVHFRIPMRPAPSLGTLGYRQSDQTCRVLRLIGV